MLQRFNRQCVLELDGSTRSGGRNEAHRNSSDDAGAFQCDRIRTGRRRRRWKLGRRIWRWSERGRHLFRNRHRDFQHTGERHRGTQQSQRISAWPRTERRAGERHDRAGARCESRKPAGPQPAKQPIRPDATEREQSAKLEGIRQRNAVHHRAGAPLNPRPCRGAIDGG
jgi:hypothetical protein